MQSRIVAGPLSTLAGLAALFAPVAGCSVNPATGRQQIALIGEADEIAMGREADQQIVAQMGLYDAPGVQEYVQAVGAGLAATSERPHLPWTFRVLDDPIVNAFALPGGFIYVTRGIMTHLNSEAELASVLGHEIGHVTARHSVNQISKQQLFGIGLGVGAILSPEVAAVSDLAAQGLGLLFLKYSRDDERQADELGVRYSIRAGFDAREGPEVYEVLERVGETSGGGRIPSWLATHPDPSARSRTVAELAAAGGRDYSSARIGRAAYLRRIDGMVFGDDPRQGYFEDALFLHPEMQFRVRFPSGWKTVNQRSVVGAVSPEKDAVVQLTLAEEADPERAARDLAGESGITAGRLVTRRINGHPAARFEFAADTDSGRLRGEAAWIRYRDTTFRLLGYAAESDWGAYDGAVGAFIDSFDRLTDPEALNVQPARVSVVDLERELPLEAFQSQYPSSVSLETLALINHVRPGDSLPAGVGAKRIVGGPGH